MNENKHIDDLFRDKLKDFMKDPPAEVWDSVVYSLKHQKRILLFRKAWKIAAGIAILLMVGLGWHLVFNRGTNVPVITAEDNGKDRDIGIVREPESQISEGKRTDLPVASLSDEDKIIVDAAIIPGKDFQVGTEKVSGQFVQKSDHIVFHPDQQFQEEELSAQVWSVLANSMAQIIPPQANQELLSFPRKQKDLQDSNLFKWDLAETEISVSSGEGRWLLSGMAAPEYSYRTLNMKDMAYQEYFNSTENAVFTWSGGLQIAYKATQRLNIHTGLLFSRSGIHIDHLSTFGNISPERFLDNYSGITTKAFVNTGNSIGSISTSSSNVVYMSYNASSENLDRSNLGSSIVNNVDLTSSLTGLDAQLTQYFDFIEFPFNLRYRLNSGKVQLNLLGGVSSNLLIGSQVIFTTGGEREKTGKTESIRTVNYSGNLGLSVDYDISDHFMLLFEPRYKYYLNSINEDRLINARPYLFGIFTGLRYKF